MLRALSIIVAVLLSIHAGASSTLAYEKGDRIVTTQFTKLTISDKLIQEVARGAVLTVAGVDGNYLWVNDGQWGWLDGTTAIPLDRGIEHFSELIRKDSKDGGAYFCRGKIYSVLGDQDAAIKDFDKSPVGAATYLARANAWNAKKDYDRAILDYEKALWFSQKESEQEKTDLGRRHALIHNCRGASYLAKGEQDKALEDFEAALKLNDSDPAIYFNRGNVWKAREEYDKAIRDYDKALRLEPEYLAAYNNRGSAWQAKEDYDKAMADYDQVLRRDTKNIRARYNRAGAWEAKGKYEEAIADFNTVRLLDPKFVDAYIGIARIRATCSESKLRNGNQAIGFATKACEMSGWKNASHLFVLAAAFAEDGQFAAAVKCQADALELAPKNQKFRYGERLNLYKSGKAYHELPRGE